MGAVRPIDKPLLCYLAIKTWPRCGIAPCATYVRLSSYSPLSHHGAAPHVLVFEHHGHGGVDLPLSLVVGVAADWFLQQR